MTVTLKNTFGGTTTTLMTGTNLNALANNALFLSGDFNNAAGSGVGSGTGDGYAMCRLQLANKMGVAAAANTGISIWFLKSFDNGTTWEDGGTAVTPTRLPDCVFPAPADTTAHFISRDLEMPTGHFKVLLKNDGTGQAFSADNTNNVLSLTPITSTGV